MYWRCGSSSIAPALQALIPTKKGGGSGDEKRKTFTITKDSVTSLAKSVGFQMRRSGLQVATVLE
jgi:hypothetical protein